VPLSSSDIGVGRIGRGRVDGVVVEEEIFEMMCSLLQGDADDAAAVLQMRSYTCLKKYRTLIVYYSMAK
jgi:hypothetical protein